MWWCPALIAIVLTAPSLGKIIHDAAGLSLHQHYDFIIVGGNLYIHGPLPSAVLTLLYYRGHRRPCSRQSTHGEPKLLSPSNRSWRLVSTREDLPIYVLVSDSGRNPETKSFLSPKYRFSTVNSSTRQQTGTTLQCL